MPPSAAETAVRTYLVALSDPSSLRDEKKVAELTNKLDAATDPLDRVKLRAQLRALDAPSADAYEDAFVEHARDWAEQHGVSVEGFLEEGVPTTVLRRAGFNVGRGTGRAGARRGRPRAAGTRKRVTVDEVRAAIPKGTFTIRELQERSGASLQVVRKVITEGLADGKLGDEGIDERHTGPGRAPRLYKKQGR